MATVPMAGSAPDFTAIQSDPQNLENDLAERNPDGSLRYTAAQARDQQKARHRAAKREAKRYWAWCLQFANQVLGAQRRVGYLSPELAIASKAPATEPQPGSSPLSRTTQKPEATLPQSKMPNGPQAPGSTSPEGLDAEPWSPIHAQVKVQAQPDAKWNS